MPATRRHRFHTTSRPSSFDAHRTRHPHHPAPLLVPPTDSRSFSNLSLLFFSAPPCCPLAPPPRSAPGLHQNICDVVGRGRGSPGWSEAERRGPPSSMPGAEPNLASERAAGCPPGCSPYRRTPKRTPRRTPCAPNGYPRRIPGLPWNHRCTPSGASRPRLKCVGALRSVGTARPSSKVPGATSSASARISSIVRRGSRFPSSSRGKMGPVDVSDLRQRFLRDVQAVAPSAQLLTEREQQPGALDRVSVMLDPHASTPSRVPRLWSVSRACAPSARAPLPPEPSAGPPPRPRGSAT